MAAQLKNLMQGLYYPAVTGTGFVLVMYRLTVHASATAVFTDFALGYGILFVIFFSASFVAISLVPGEDYSVYEFVLDVLEVCLAFAAFFFLGLFDTSSATPPAPNLAGVYAAIALLALVQMFWRFFFLDGHGASLGSLRLVTFIVAAAGAAYLSRYAWFNAGALVVLLGCAWKYLLIMKARSEAQGQGTPA